MTDEWVEIRREAIRRQGFAVRASPAVDDRAAPNAIEIKGGQWRTDQGGWIGPFDDVWRRIELAPGQVGSTEFATAELRDDVMRRLTERK